ncbi:MAG: hypothetical protein ABIE23_03425 [archaeon]|nr:hypothetical protein [Candidatus Micrarchaeota archaeon]
MEKKPFLILVQHGSVRDRALSKLLKGQSEVFYRFFIWPRIEKALNRTLKRGMVLGMEVYIEELRNPSHPFSKLIKKYCLKKGVKIVPLISERFDRVYNMFSVDEKNRNGLKELIKKLKKEGSIKGANEIEKILKDREAKQDYVKAVLLEKTMIQEMKREKVDAAIMGLWHQTVAEKLGIPPRKCLKALTPTGKIYTKAMIWINEKNKQRVLRLRGKLKRDRLTKQKQKGRKP